MTTDAYNNTVTETRTYNTDNTLASISFNKAIGNMTYGWDSVTTNGTAQSRTHGPTHELLTGGGGSAVSTDVKGNITLVPPSLRPILTMQWDMDNRLTTATAGATTISHQYDALGRRVAHTKGSTTTVFVPSGQQTICDYVAGAAPASSTYRYVYASYIDEPVMRWQRTGGVRVYYHRNQQYSITALTSASGGLLERYAYTAYGVPTITNGSGAIRSASAHNNRYTYTGREWDSDLRLYHYRARMYDPSLGRFCSRDPIGYWDGGNLFRAYFPPAAVDPFGLEVWFNPRTGQTRNVPEPISAETRRILEAAGFQPGHRPGTPPGHHHPIDPPIELEPFINCDPPPQQFDFPGWCDGKEYDSLTQCCKNKQIVPKDKDYFEIHGFANAEACAQDCLWNATNGGGALTTGMDTAAAALMGWICTPLGPGGQVACGSAAAWAAHRAQELYCLALCKSKTCPEGSLTP